MLSWPLWPHRRLPVYPDDLLRHELMSRSAKGAGARCRTSAAGWTYFNHTGGPRECEQPPWSPHAEYLVHWAEAVAAQHLPKPKGAHPRPDAGDPPRAVVGRHPLVESPTREGFSTMSELRAALEIESYREAAQVDHGDGRLRSVGVSCPTGAIRGFPRRSAWRRAVVRDRPALAKSIQEAAAAVGQLRLRQAASSGNPAPVEAVAYQFPGTEVAAAAFRWLGDRELSMGRFVEASAWYRRAYSGTSPADREAAGRPGPPGRGPARTRRGPALPGAGAIGRHAVFTGRVRADDRETAQARAEGARGWGLGAGEEGEKGRRGETERG